MREESRSVEERIFSVNGLNVAAKVWASLAQDTAQKTNIIALHGWLDNANSFDCLAPLLPNCHIVAIDSIGHGNSDFRSRDAQYVIWAEVDEVMQVAEQLGWDNFVLMGHSRGAGIASIVAGTFPEQIRKLVLLEGGVPMPMSPEGSPENLAKSIQAGQKLAGTVGTLFTTREAAISARADGFMKVDIQTAEILANRSLKNESGGYRWHADARLKGPSFKLIDSQIKAFLSNISAPTLLCLADNGILLDIRFAQPHIDEIPKLEKLNLQGGHHFHLEGAEADIADRINEFLGEGD